MILYTLLFFDYNQLQLESLRHNINVVDTVTSGYLSKIISKVCMEQHQESVLKQLHIQYQFSILVIWTFKEFLGYSKQQYLKSLKDSNLDLKEFLGYSKLQKPDNSKI